MSCRAMMFVRRVLPLLAFATILLINTVLSETKRSGASGAPNKIVSRTRRFVSSGVPCPEHTCNDGECYTKEERCDGTAYCYDGSDEEDCDEVCSEDEFRCAGDGSCISQKKKCDRTKDCPDGSDERDCSFKQNCSADEFQCFNGKCIFNELVCDGVDHCGDKSDEWNCTRNTCPTKTYDCQGDGRKCLQMDKLCDGKMDCDNGSDENDCGALTDLEEGDYYEPEGDCSSFVFRCQHTCSKSRGFEYCLCHEGYHLDEDNSTCRIDGDEPLLWLANDTKLIKYALYSKDVLGVYDIGFPVSIFAFDFDENLLMWSNHQDEIKIMRMDNKTPEMAKTLVRTQLAQTITAIAYDWMNGNLYWTESDQASLLEDKTDDGSKIGVIPVEKSNPMHVTILSSPNVSQPNNLVLDPRNKARHLYWTQLGQHAGLFRSDMDGSNVVNLKQAKRPLSLAIDYIYEWLLWIDAEDNILYITSLFEETTIMAFERHTSAVALAVFEGSVYLGENGNFKETKLWMSDDLGDALPQLATIRAGFITVQHPNAQPKEEASPCSDENVCDHLCLPGKSGPLCRCYDIEFLKAKGAFYELLSDNKTCFLREEKQPTTEGEIELQTTAKSNIEVTAAPLNITGAATKSNRKEIVLEVTTSRHLGMAEVPEKAKGAKLVGDDDEGHGDVAKISNVAQSSGNSDMTLGVAWIYFTLASLAFGLLAIIAAGAYKLKTSRDSRRVTSKESTPLKQQPPAASFSNLPI